MKYKAISFLALTTLCACVVCLFQRSQIRELKSQETSLRDTVEKQNRRNEITEAKLKQVQRERSELSHELNTGTREPQPLRAAGIEPSQASPPTPPAATSPAGQEQSKSGLFGDFLSKMLDDPNMKKMMRQQQGVMMDMMYGGLFKDLGLTSEETEQFKQLLLDHQMKAVEAGGAFMQLQGESVDRADAMRELAVQQKDFDAQVKAFLGDERYGRYQDYNETLAERMTLNQFSQQLASGENPLNPDQSAQLLDILKQEKKASGSVFADAGADPSADPAKWQAMMSEEKMDAFFKEQEAMNQRVLERAKAVLSPAQLEAFSRHQSSQLQMQRMGMTMAVKMFGPQKSDASAPANRNP